METEFFAGQAIRAQNPLREYAISRLVVGLVYSGVGLLVLLDWVGQSGQFVNDVLAGAEPSPADLGSAFRAVVALALLASGIGMLGRGIAHVGRLVIPARAPRDLQPAELQSALQRREMSAYSVHQGEDYWGLRYWFPDRFPLMTRHERGVLTRGLREGPRVARLVLVTGTAAWIAVNVTPGAVSLTGAALPGFLLLYTTGALAHIVLAMRAAPSASPRADVIEFRSSIRGAGDPNAISHGLEHELAVIRPAIGTPNRGFQTGFAMAGGGVENAGQFEGQVFVENQPETVQRRLTGPVLALLSTGSAYQIAALIWLLREPSAELTLIVSGAVVPSPLLAPAYTVLGVLLAALGTRMVSNARLVRAAFRFQSLAVLLDVRGTYGRSNIRVGKGIHDSIESENLVIRSDYSLTGYSARILSESQGLTGPRHVIGMIVDDGATAVEGIVQRWLLRHEHQGATIVGADLKDAKLADLMTANIAVSAQRSDPQEMHASIPARSLEGPLGGARRLGDGGTGHGAREDQPVRPASAWKSCPMCAEEIREAAVICRFCGYSYRPDEAR